MESTALTHEILPETSYSSLYMRLSPKCFDVMIYNPTAEEGELIHRAFTIAPEGEARLKSIEDIIYDNPLLLADFARISLIVETREFMLIPSEITDSDTRKALLKAQLPDMQGRHEIVNDNLADLSADILTAIPTEIHSFFMRTFPGIRLGSNLAPLTAYCRASLSSAGIVKCFVNMRNESFDLLILGRNSLVMANRFEYRSIEDAAFLVLTALDNSRSEVAEVIVGGERHPREQLTAQLRRYRDNVMPMIFPSAMFRAGKESLTTPFDLLIMPLCE